MGPYLAMRLDNDGLLALQAVISDGLKIAAQASDLGHATTDK